VAQLSAARAQVQVSEAAYLQLVGDRPGRLQGASPAGRLLPSGMEQAIAIGLSEHPAIKATLHLVDAAAFQVKAQEGALLPQVSAQAGVSRSFTDLPGVNGGLVGTREGTSDSASIGLNLTIPIYS